MRLISIYILFFCFCFTVKSQQLFYQNTFHGGVTAEGKNHPEIAAYLATDTINFSISITPTATVKKAFLFYWRFVFGVGEIPKHDDSFNVIFNSQHVLFDSTKIVGNSFNCAQPGPSIYSNLLCTDVSNLALNNQNKLIIPNQALMLLEDTSRHFVYHNPYLIIFYEDNTMSSVNGIIFINDKSGNTFSTDNLIHFNPIDNSRDVGIAIHNSQFANNQQSSYTFTINNNNTLYYLGQLHLSAQPEKNFSTSGSFFYENNVLTGIGDDIADPFIDSTDALAEISTYINNNQTSLQLKVTSFEAIGCAEQTLGYVLAYTTPCPARGFNDTLVKYTICEGQSVILNTQSIGNTYSWYPKRSLNDSTLATPIATPTITTNYIVSIDSAGCKHTEQVQVAVITKPTIDTIITTNDVCGGPQGKITVNIKHSSSEPYSYSINGEPYINNNVFNNLSAGDYTISISNNAGCISDNFTATVNSTLEVNTIFSSQTATSNYIAPLSIYFSNSTTGANNYNWYINNVFESSALNYFHTFTDSGIYSIMLIAYNNIPTCADTSYLNITVLPQDTSGVFIPNVFSPNGDGINDTFEIKYEHAEEISMTIYDRWGNEVFIKGQKNVNTGIISWNGKNASGTECAAGTYFYIVTIKADKKYNKIPNKEYKGFLSLLR